MLTAVSGKAEMTNTVKIWGINGRCPGGWIEGYVPVHLNRTLLVSAACRCLPAHCLLVEPLKRKLTQNFCIFLSSITCKSDISELIYTSNYPG